MQRPSHVGEHVPINMSRLYSRGDISLKIRDQPGRVRVPAVAAQVLEQLLQQKQITERKASHPCPLEAATCSRAIDVVQTQQAMF